jgi:YCII-related domain/LysE type translocator
LKQWERTLQGSAGTYQTGFLQGMATEVLNPKTALFLSFIPQFVSPAKGHLILQFLILGAISVVLNTTVDLVVVGFAGLIAQRLARNPKLIERQRIGSGVGMIGLGLYVAVLKWIFGHERQNWMSDDVELLKRVYDLFNSRDIESVLAAMHPEGHPGTTDGPYADTKEQLAGFIILELPSVDAALEWAARCPGASISARGSPR